MKIVPQNLLTKPHQKKKKKIPTRKNEASNERKVRLRNAPNPILSWSPNVAYE